MNIVIDDYETTKMIDYDESGVFENWRIFATNTRDGDVSKYVSTSDPPKVDDVEASELSEPKWENGAHSKKNIIGVVLKQEISTRDFEL